MVLTAARSLTTRTAVVVLGAALALSAAVATGSHGSPEGFKYKGTGGSLNGGSLNGGSLNDFLNGGSLNGGSLNGGSLNGGSLN